MGRAKKIRVPVECANDACKAITVSPCKIDSQFEFCQDCAKALMLHHKHMHIELRSPPPMTHGRSWDR
jgi:hypothetical protein